MKKVLSSVIFSPRHYSGIRHTFKEPSCQTTARIYAICPSANKVAGVQILPRRDSLVSFSPAVVSVRVQKTHRIRREREKKAAPGGDPRGETRRESAGKVCQAVPLTRCPGVCSRGIPIPRALSLDMPLIICCVTVVSLELAEASGVCPRASSKLFFFSPSICVCVCGRTRVCILLSVCVDAAKDAL